MFCREAVYRRASPGPASPHGSPACRPAAGHTIRYFRRSFWQARRYPGRRRAGKARRLTARRPHPVLTVEAGQPRARATPVSGRASGLHQRRGTPRDPDRYPGPRLRASISCSGLGGSTGVRVRASGVPSRLSFAVSAATPRSMAARASSTTADSGPPLAAGMDQSPAAREASSYKDDSSGSAGGSAARSALASRIPWAIARSVQRLASSIFCSSPSLRAR